MYGAEQLASRQSSLTAPIHPPERVIRPPELHHSKGRYRARFPLTGVSHLPGIIMKPLKLFKIAFVTLTTGLLLNQSSFAETPKLEINSEFDQDPLELSGLSGGSVKSNCGNIDTAPNSIMQLTEPLPYLRLTVKSEGQPTLLINGPGGRICVLADSYSGGKAEFSGYWQEGKYSLYIGDLTQPQQKFNYTLTISLKKAIPK